MFRQKYDMPYLSNRAEKVKREEPTRKYYPLPRIDNFRILNENKNFANNFLYKPPTTTEGNFQNFLLLQEKNYLANKINIIRNRPVKPKLNSTFIEIKSKILEYKRRYREKDERVLSIENQKYRERIFGIPAVYYTSLGKEFQREHERLIALIYKSKRSNLLPKIPKKLRIKAKSAWSLPDDETNSVNTSINNIYNSRKHIKINSNSNSNSNYKSNNKSSNDTIRKLFNLKKNNATNNLNNSSSNINSNNNSNSNICKTEPFDLNQNNQGKPHQRGGFFITNQ